MAGGVEMIVRDPGHFYELRTFKGKARHLRFLKRSGGAIKYATQYDGLQTQEVLRALIDRTKYLDSVLPCIETKDAIYYLRAALFEYEVRAYRRKQQKKNQKKPKHIDIMRPKSWRVNPYADVPFNEDRIELRKTGKDGHLLLRGVN